jgi:hypothetical protein
MCDVGPRSPTEWLKYRDLGRRTLPLLLVLAMLIVSGRVLWRELRGLSEVPAGPDSGALALMTATLHSREAANQVVNRLESVEPGSTIVLVIDGPQFDRGVAYLVRYLTWPRRLTVMDCASLSGSARIPPGTSVVLDDSVIATLNGQQLVPISVASKVAIANVVGDQAELRCMKSAL